MATLFSIHPVQARKKESTISTMEHFCYINKSRDESLALFE